MMMTRVRSERGPASRAALLALLLSALLVALPISVSAVEVAQFAVSGSSMVWNAMIADATVKTNLMNALSQDVSAATSAAGISATFSVTDLTVNASAMYAAVQTTDVFTPSVHTTVFAARLTQTNTLVTSMASQAPLNTMTSIIPRNIQFITPLPPAPNDGSGSGSATNGESLTTSHIMFISGSFEQWFRAIRTREGYNNIAEIIQTALEGAVNRSRMLTLITITGITPQVGDDTTISNGFSGATVEFTVEQRFASYNLHPYTGGGINSVALLASTADLAAALASGGPVIKDDAKGAMALKNPHEVNRARSTTEVTVIAVRMREVVGMRCSATCKGMIAMGAAGGCLMVLTIIILSIAACCCCCCDVEARRRMGLEDKRPHNTESEPLSESGEPFRERRV